MLNFLLTTLAIVDHDIDEHQHIFHKKFVCSSNILHYMNDIFLFPYTLFCENIFQCSHDGNDDTVTF
jgi:hypothetical protein